MKKPLIGLNPYYFEYSDAMWNGSKYRYFTAIWAAGGIPVTLHYPNQDDSINEIAQAIDGLLLVGGPDIPNNIYIMVITQNYWIRMLWGQNEKSLIEIFS